MPNVGMLEEAYSQYKADRESVEASWRYFFDGLEFAMQERGRSAGPSDLRVHHLITSYRVYGHLLAQINPIDAHPVTKVPQLELETLGFEEKELTEGFPTCGLLEQEEAPLGEIIDRLRQIYCSKMGFEYMGLQRPDVEQWFQEKLEPTAGQPQLDLDQKRLILDCLNRSELFEIFLHTKYVGQKRFSLEGGEALIPILRGIVEGGAAEYVIGMAHRGRLNVLANVLNKSYANIFHEFEDTPIEDSYDISGDVKYHKGYSADVKTTSGKDVHLSIAANPSHLESVNPVVQGSCRAKQVMRGDDRTMQQVVPITIHGDAALAGQGVVYETMQMCNLSGYDVGGTIHVVVNNQIGFTTLPKDGRSTRYCTDIARTFSAPVIHVNGEDAEGCYYAALLAIEFRQKFGGDIFIDLNCYRKYGHNEADEPAFTQPLEYAMIRAKSSPREIYRDELIQQGVLERQVAEELEAEFRAELQRELDQVQSLKTEPEREKMKDRWARVRDANWTEDPFAACDTSVPAEKLRELAQKICAIPDGFNIHRKIKRLQEDRLKMVEGSPMNWGMAETLAYASLLDEGIHVRLSGQDSRRGTFNHRQAMWMDQKEEGKYFPLNHIREGQGRFDLFNSLLSEYAAMAFEFGYSMAYCDALVLWEAQFGDFANTAQVAIDQYVSTSEQKWSRISGMVLLLPHGYEGQGPEHSSARMERYLQLTGDNNMRVANPSTPAQMFHLLRRQVLRESRKPLVIFTPKQLFGHPKCVSDLSELAEGGFQEILDDPLAPTNTRKLVFCSGHIYYDLIKAREERQANDVAIVRIEQLYPLHTEKIAEMVQKYPGEIVWAQEEPSNMGAWEFIRDHLNNPTLVSRPRSASPATGSPRKHKAQTAEIIEKVFA